MEILYNIFIMKYTEDYKIDIWCLGALKGLVDLGLVKEGCLVLTIKGISIFDQIDVEFSPTDHQLMRALYELEKSGAIQKIKIHVLFLLLCGFRDHRKHIKQWARLVAELNEN